MSHEHGKSSKSKSKSFQRIWRNTQLGDQLNGGHSRRHTPFTVMSYNVLSDDLMKQQNGWVVVDYMLYSTSYSEKYNKFVEGNLKLVSKLELLSGQQCREMGGLPSNACPSDHLSLVAKFLLCN